MKALISVFYKEGIDRLARSLTEKGYELVSSGGTYKYLKEAGFNVASVEEVTGFPEMLDGRVKTLHPRIHGGLLARRDLKDHMDTLKEHDIDTIDVVCVTLYPFREKLKENLSFDEMVEFIDIGGPSMLRSAAKNFRSVCVLSDPSQYDGFIDRLDKGDLTEEYRKSLARDVYRLTSEYDRSISEYLASSSEVEKYSEDGFLDLSKDIETFPENLTIRLKKARDLRYGENPHQKGAFYEVVDSSEKGFMTDFEKLNGKDLGHINYKDLEAAWNIACEFEEPCAAAVKHNTPCGVALGEDIYTAYRRCYECDEVSIFGGIVALNREVDLKTAEELTSIMLHAVVAPSFTKEALEKLREKKNLIVIRMARKPSDALTLVSAEGGLLLQETDRKLYDRLENVTERKPTEDEMRNLDFAMRVVKYVKSNAIVVAKDLSASGIGGGYVNRIDAARYAMDKAGRGGVLASDAFFPFRDVVDAAHDSGITAIIQPGGSLRDEDSIEACNERGIAMVFTHMRHFRH